MRCFILSLQKFILLICCISFTTVAYSAMKPYSYYMSELIPLAEQNPKYPYASMLVDDETGAIVSEGLNDAGADPSLHGEMVAIQSYAKAHLHDADWHHLVLFTTAEPCPMCMGAIIWAGIPTVVYGTSIPYLIASGRNQINIRAATVAKAAPFYHGKIIGGVLQQETDKLFPREA